MKDTRNLFEEREDLKATILADFNEMFPEYETDDFDDILFDEEEIQSWKEDWVDELEKIEEIDTLEREVGSEFEYGVTLIPLEDFTDYVEEMLVDCGDLPSNIPSYISIDWEDTADNIKVDYSEVEFQGTDYLFRI
nr:hypothetical protein [uncultured Flavobacterium sp.]